MGFTLESRQGFNIHRGNGEGSVSSTSKGAKDWDMGFTLESRQGFNVRRVKGERSTVKGEGSIKGEGRMGNGEGSKSGLAD